MPDGPAPATDTALDLRRTEYDHPDAARLVAAVQQVYVARYGGTDSTPVDPAQFRPPRGWFVVGYAGGEPVACGGWRLRGRTGNDAVPTDGDAVLKDGDAEIKRMYVVEAARGLGFARRVLAELERSAAEAGALRMVLETGTRQPEAIALYRSSGYYAIPKFGLYRCEPNSRCFAKPLGRRPGRPG